MCWLLEGIPRDDVRGSVLETAEVRKAVLESAGVHRAAGSLSEVVMGNVV